MRRTRHTERDVTPYKLARRVYWAKLKVLLEDRYGRRPTSEGHRIADLAFRRKVPLTKLARHLAKDRRLSTSAYELHIQPLMRIR